MATRERHPPHLVEPLERQPPAPQQAIADRINEVDLLRFLAALAVVLFHYTFRGYAADDLSVVAYPDWVFASKYGYLGVDLFFMISGFVILMSAAAGGLRAFVVSRVVRLYPAFWVCCTLTALVTVALQDRRFEIGWVQYAANMTMLSDFFGVPSVDGAYWSLFVEIRFYVLVALLVRVGWIERPLPALNAWLLLAWVLHFFPSYRLSRFLATDYAAYFVAGATCYLIRSSGITGPRVATLFLSWLLALLHGMLIVDEFELAYREQLDRPVVAALISLFFAVMLAIAVRRTGRLARLRWVQLGALTYPLYLLHQNIGYMIFNSGHTTVAPGPLLAGTVALALAGAYAVHSGCEKPLARYLKRVLARSPE